MLAPFASGPVAFSADGQRLRAAVPSTPGLATAVVRALDQAGITVDDAEIRQPSLDDVFFALTGHTSRQAQDGPGTPPSGPAPSASGATAATR